MSQIPKTDQIIDLLVEQTNHTKEEIVTMIEKTIEDMDNMVNREGAAYVVANNLGVMINLNKTTETLTIDQLIPGQSNVTIIARISKIFNTRTFTRNDNTPGKVRNIEIIDRTGLARVALWDSKTEIIEEKEISVGKIIRISGATTKTGYQEKIELSLSAQGLIDEIKGINEDDYPEIKRAPLISINEIDPQEKNDVSIRGKLIERQGIVSFNRNDGSTGKVTSLTIKDLEGSIRITFWDEAIEKAAGFDVGNIVKILDVRPGESNYGKELTFNSYSSIKKIENPELDKIKIVENNELESLSQIENGMQKITIIAKITSFGEIRTFERDGLQNQVANMTVSDSTLSVRTTLWGQQVSILDSYNMGDIIKISNVSAKLSDYSGEIELSVGDNSIITNVSQEVDPEKFKKEDVFVYLKEIHQTVRGVSIKVQLSRKFDVRDVTLKDGNVSKVINGEVYDPQGQRGRLAAWDDNISKIDQIPEGQAIILYNVRIKPSDGEYPPEILVNQDTQIEETELDDIIPIIQSAANVQKNPLIYQKQTLDRLTKDSNIEISGTVVKAYKPAFYRSCTQCNRKVVSEEGIFDIGTCSVHGEVETKMRMILSMVLDDTNGTATIKLFDITAEEFLGMTADEAVNLIERLSDDNAPIKQQNIEMKDVSLKGKVIEDDYSQQLQINVDTINFLDHSKEAGEFLDKYE